ncbi:MAG: hypothetical protein PHU56_02540 [Candidatus Pacebacteria bacterium]|nr:hypothetical protein [Candidatus Paceibacterota bacterium]
MSNHHCEYLVFRCMDFRIKGSVLGDLLDGAGIGEGNYDLVACAGSAKDLLGREEEKNFLLKQIALSRKLHQIKNVAVLYHDNCGAYGIADQEQEDEIQRNDLVKIKGIIAEQFPDLRFTAFIIKGVLLGDISLEKIF